MIGVISLIIGDGAGGDDQLFDAPVALQRGETPSMVRYSGRLIQMIFDIDEERCRGDDQLVDASAALLRDDTSSGSIRFAE